MIYECLHTLYPVVVYKRTHRDSLSSCINNTRNSYAYTHTVYTKICRHINNNNLKLVCKKVMHYNENNIMEKINATGKQDNRVDIIKSKKKKNDIFYFNLRAC